MKRIPTAAVLALLGLIGGSPSARAEEKEPGTLYFFFSEKTSAAAEAAKAVVISLAKAPRDLVLRPALLVEDWSTFTKVAETSPLYRTIRALGRDIPLQVFDEEALKLAQAWKITRLPALVLVERARAHVLQGAVAGLEELLGCSR